MAWKIKKAGDPVDSMFRILLCYFLVLWCLIYSYALPTNQKQVYIIALKDGAKLEMGIQALDVQDQHLVILDTALGFGANYQVLHDYDSVFDGMAVALNDAQAAVMKLNPFIRSVEPDATVYTTTTHSHEYMLLPNPYGAWNESGGTHNAGEDIVIGVVDTGIYPDHPSFAATDGIKPYGPHPTYKGLCGTDPLVPNGFCNGKIISAQQFFKAKLMTSGANLSDPDYYSPLDGSGHGTHCAGIAAGNYGVPVVVNGVDYGMASGTAPRARIAVYKALSKDSMGTIADTIAAINQAVKDGVHVISLSLGVSEKVGTLTVPNLLEMACLGAVKAGVPVIHAAGNAGPELSSIQSHGPWLTSVGATTLDRSYSAYLYTDDGKVYSGQGFSPGTIGMKNYPLVRASDVVTEPSNMNQDFSCADRTVLVKKLIQGNILVCMYSGIQSSFTSSLPTLTRAAAQEMGAVGVVLVDSPGFFLEKSPEYWDFKDFPSIVISGTTGQLFLDNFRNENHGVKGRLSGVGKAMYTGLPPKIAKYSGRGPNIYVKTSDPSMNEHAFADVLKPTVVAPGVSIWSSWSPLPSSSMNSFRGQKWAMLSGTRMATPHIAGVVAIIRQNHPHWSPAAITSAISTTAVSLDSLDNPLIALDEEFDDAGNVIRVFERPGTVNDFGHDFVDAWASLHPGLIFDATYADYINFLCSLKFLSPNMVPSMSGEKCPPGVHKPTDLNMPSITISTLIGTLVVPRNVTNVGNLETYTAVVTQPLDVNVTVDPATFTIAPGATQLLTVTLTALKNSMHENQTNFGRLDLIGNLGHAVKVPITVIFKKVPESQM